MAANKGEESHYPGYPVAASPAQARWLTVVVVRYAATVEEAGHPSSL